MRKRKSRKKSAWDKIEEYGIDASIIRHNLELSPHERVVEHQKTLKFYLALKTAGKKYYARLGKNIKDFD
jgi:hypothetical protein